MAVASPPRPLHHHYLGGLRHGGAAHAFVRAMVARWAPVARS
jgi:hypothetical protein